MAMLDPIYARIAQNAAEFPQKYAVICGEITLTYAQFFDQVQGWINWLPDTPGQSIAVLLPNCAELLSLLTATSQLGLNLQVLSSEWPAEKIAQTLNELQPTVLIDDKALVNIQLSSEEADPGPAACDCDLPFYTGFTSGSTGGAKGFVRSQKSWLESFQSDQMLFQFREDDVFVIPGSLSHSLPLYGAMRGLYQGGTVYLAPRFRPDRIVRDCEAFNASVLYATPTQYRALMDHAIGKDISLSSVRMVLSAGSKFPFSWMADLKAVFPKAKYYEFYGTSELSYVSAREMTSTDAPTSVGVPMDGVSVRVLNDAGWARTPHVVGRIFVKSPFLFMGYTGPKGVPDLSNCDFEDGYLSVGDKGYLDGQGVLNLVGRVDHVFQSSGRNVDPQSIETVISAEAGVKHCAVIGVDDERREQRIAAILSLEPDADVNVILKTFRQKLPTYLVPQQVYICTNWPLTHSHKTDYSMIRNLLESQKLRRVR